MLPQRGRRLGKLMAPLAGKTPMNPTLSCRLREWHRDPYRLRHPATPWRSPAEPPPAPSAPREPAAAGEGVASPPAREWLRQLVLLVVELVDGLLAARELVLALAAIWLTPRCGGCQAGWGTPGLGAIQAMPGAVT